MNLVLIMYLGGIEHVRDVYEDEIFLFNLLSLKYINRLYFILFYFAILKFLAILCIFKKEYY